MVPANAQAAPSTFVKIVSPTKTNAAQASTTRRVPKRICSAANASPAPEVAAHPRAMNRKSSAGPLLSPYDIKYNDCICGQNDTRITHAASTRPRNRQAAPNDATVLAMT